MKLYKVSYDYRGTNRQAMIVTPLKDRDVPRYIIEIDFGVLGFVTEKCGNAGMIEAIKAAEILTNCEVSSVKSN